MPDTPLGAVTSAGGVSFQVWAPDARDVALLLRDGSGDRLVRPRQESDGYWLHREPGAGPGLRYGYLLDGEGPFPDPCSRWQPDGVHELSAVAPTPPAGGDHAWEAPSAEDLVVYELHAGTFTPDGTFRGVVSELDRLATLGINAIELMPVASFPGRWNWGYDGVALWAPFEGYGGPDGLRELVTAAHRRGIAVILDVVYNHFGPDGNYAGRYSKQYYRPDRSTPWGDAMNFDGDGSRQVRRFFIENAVHWLTEYGIDGLRLDATHAILDDSPEHFLAEMSRIVRSSVARRVYLIAETHENDSRYVQPTDSGGFGFDAVWADDFHHAARTSVAGDHEGYFAGFNGLESLARVVEHGWLYDGQEDPGYGAPRGAPCDVPRWSNLVFCLQNHDQVGNRPFGERLTRSAGESAVRALTMLLLLHPATPMLFQGQEFGSARPFLFFTDHSEELAAAIRVGRREEFAKFSAFSNPALRERIPDPQDLRTFQASKIEALAERDPRSALLQDYHKELLALRHRDEVLAQYRRERLPIAVSVHGEVLTALLTAGDGSRLLVVNLGVQPASCPVPSGSWRCALSSDQAEFGGYAREVRLGPGQLEVPARTSAFLVNA